MKTLSVQIKELGNVYGTLGWLSRHNIEVSFNTFQDNERLCKITLIEEPESVENGRGFSAKGHSYLYCDMDGNFYYHFNEGEDIEKICTPATFAKLKDIASLAIGEFYRQWNNDGKGINLELAFK